MSSTDKLGLINALRDWVAPYDLARGKDMYTSYYLAQNPPYYPSHQLLTSASELRLIKDLSATQYQRLEHYVTALPETTAININTTPLSTLQLLGNGLSKNQAQELINARGEEGINNLAKINELLKKLDISNKQITVESQYFLCVARAQNQELTKHVYTLLKRTRGRRDEVQIKVLYVSTNGLD